jgi:hypothetical protein
MKRIVFLLALLVLLQYQPIVAAPGEYNVDDFEIKISKEYEEGKEILVIQKIGNNPFLSSYNGNGAVHTVQNIVIIDGYFYLYGSLHLDGQPTYYDAFLLVLDVNGTIVDSKMYDFGFLEQIDGVYMVDGILMLHISQHDDIDRDIFFYKTYFVTISNSYDILDSVTYPTEILNIKVIDNNVLFSHENDDVYEGSINNLLEFTSKEDSLNVVDGDVFYNEVKIDFINTAYLNNEPVTNGVDIDYPGYYTIKYNNKDVSFVVKPIVTGIEDNKVYLSDVSINVSSGMVTLNGDAYLNESIINEPGNYTLIISGINGYEEVYNFTITADVSGIINDQEYEDSVVFYFKGEGYLNNQYVESPVEISNQGEYRFYVEGNDGYSETYDFKIVKNNDEFDVVSLIQKYDIVILVVTVIGSVIIIKKK